jgi:S-DNA-T family DNA segregation ATPase FtsK/SpoIIIE
MLTELALIAAGGVSIAATFLPKRTTQIGQLKDVWLNTGLAAVKRDGRVVMPRVVKRTKTKAGHFFTITLPPGICPTDIRNRQEEIEFALGAEIEISDNGKGTLFINAYEKELKDYREFDLDLETFIDQYPDKILPIPIGYSRAGLEVRDLVEFPHMLIPGETYGGKSVLLHQILVTLAHNPRVMLFTIDMARVELSYLKNHSYFAWNMKDARAILEYLHQEMFRRMEALDRAGVVKIQDYSDEYMPYYVLAVEEFSQFAPVLAKHDKKKKAEREYVHSLLTDILCLARKVGIHVIITTQRPDRDILPGQLKANIPGTVCFKVRNKTNSEICLDNDKADKLPRIKGRAVFQFDCERVVQVMHLPIQQAKALLPEQPLTKPELPIQNCTAPVAPVVEPY